MGIDMFKRVLAYVIKNQMIEPGDYVAAGISGGADSVGLLFILLKLQKEIPFTLKAVHVNHMLRAGAAKDAAFVGEICRKQGVELEIFSAQVAEMAKEKGLSLEEAGREYRYECFRKALTGHGQGKIAVAHHQDDRAETLLFNLFRGSGLKGLSGIRPVRDNIIRPLLCCTRQEIENYLENRKIPYRTDPTNAEDIYTRNRIRRHIITFAAEVNPAAIRHMAKPADLVWEAESFIHKHTEQVFRECVNYSGGQNKINIKKLNEQDPVIQKRILMLAIELLHPGCRDISARHIESLLKLTVVDGGTKSQELHLPYCLIACKEYDTLVIKRVPNALCQKERKNHSDSITRIDGRDQTVNDALPSYEITVHHETCPEQSIKIPGLGIFSCRLFSYQKNGNIPQKIYTKWFDYDKITSHALFRPRKPGDFLMINRDCQRKKLRDYLINEKIPRAKRAEMYVLADGSHIIWIPGLRISEYYKVTAATATVLEIDLELSEQAN